MKKSKKKKLERIGFFCKSCEQWVPKANNGIHTCHDAELERVLRKPKPIPKHSKFVEYEE